MVSGTDTVAVVQAEGPRPVIGLFAGRTGAVLMQAPSKTDTICRGYPAHTGSSPTLALTSTLGSVAIWRLDCVPQATILSTKGLPIPVVPPSGTGG